MGKLGGLAVVAIVVTVGCSPYGGGAFACATDDQCSNASSDGTCVSTTGFCAFADVACASGLRYGALAGALSNTCVAGASEPDGGGSNCYGTGLISACIAMPPSGTIAITAAIDTDTSLLCSTVASSPPLCVIAGSDITVTGTIAASGSRPLFLLATGTVHISGVLDLASHRAGAAIDPGQVGAGAVPAADTTQCDRGMPPGPSGGGAGGSFGGAGASGGDPMHGMAGVVKTVTALRGGCAGQDGAGGTPGMGGLGGGALYVFAGTSITIDGTIDASGAAGTHGVISDGGAGGGGSGGLIMFDAPIVTSTAEIFANGGGGAEGSSITIAGSDGNEATSTAAAPPSGNLSNGGGGGAGAAQGSPPGTGTTTGDGGGGGGGGLGVIALYQVTTLGGQTSPMVTKGP